MSREANKKKNKKKKEIQKKKKAIQKNFELAVRTFRDNVLPPLNLTITSKHWDYGKDPQHLKSNLGKKKRLHRACSKDVNEALALWIAGHQINYCMLSKGQTNCCYNMNEIKFDQQEINLTEELAKQLTKYQGQLPNHSWERSWASWLITEANENCILQVNGLQFYLKLIKQDALSSSMEVSQNPSRVSHAPVILIEINGIFMRIRSERAGVGYYDLVQHKLNEELKKDSSCLRHVIYIHEEFLLDTYISFGVKVNSSCSISNTGSMIIKNDKLKDDYGGSVCLVNNVPTLNINPQYHYQLQNPFGLVNNNNNNYTMVRGGQHHGYCAKHRDNPLASVISSSNHSRSLPSINPK